jgi:hypothetical protein
MNALAGPRAKLRVSQKVNVRDMPNNPYIVLDAIYNLYRSEWGYRLLSTVNASATAETEEYLTEAK